ncbi:hypothetical protein [Bailinhaonella thermotolerans]|nr:hypothetical protein [Bailinhaonella thermotolerans]
MPLVAPPGAVEPSGAPPAPRAAVRLPPPAPPYGRRPLGRGAAGV